MATQKSKVGATPNGGVRSTVYFLDDARRPIDESQATQVEIVEFDAAGQEVFRTYGTIGASGAKKKGK